MPGNPDIKGHRAPFISDCIHGGNLSNDELMKRGGNSYQAQIGRRPWNPLVSARICVFTHYGTTFNILQSFEWEFDGLIALLFNYAL